MASSTTARRRLRSFMRWMECRDFEISDGLELVHGDSNGIDCGELGVRAAYDFQEGDAIAFIPKDACLTLRTTGAAYALDRAQLGGGLGLVAALMYERSRAEASPWFPYLNLLPMRHGALPMVWEPEEVDALLLGTELHTVVMEDRRLMEEDWRECIWPLTQVYPNEFPEKHFTLEHYFSAKTVVASRSFEVDNFHGYGMVPLADLFNHKTRGEDVHIMRETDTDLNFGRASAEVKRDSSGSRRGEDTIFSESGSHLSFKNAKGQGSSDVLEIILIKDVSEGSEIFNTYGELSNASLLHRHGFTESDNPFDIVNIDFTLVMQYCALFFSERHLRERVRLWKKYGCSVLRWETTEYFEIEACGKPQRELLFLLYLLHLPEKAVLAADIALHKMEAASQGNQNGDFVHWEVKVAKTITHLCKKASRKGSRHLEFQFEQEVTELDRIFHTVEVCEALFWLSERRDEAYGQTSLEEDIKLLNGLNPKENPKAFHALSLRISERSILKRLSCVCTEKLEKCEKLQSKEL